MEKVIVKIELERDDVSAMFRLLGNKLSDEMWEKIKDRECVLEDDDMKEQASTIRLMFGALAIGKLLNGECTDIETKRSRSVNSFSKRMEEMERQREILRKGKGGGLPDITIDKAIEY
jgi:hypothetical protein